MDRGRARKTNNNNKFSSKSDLNSKIDPEGTRSPIGPNGGSFFKSPPWLYYSIKKFVDMSIPKNDILIFK